MSVLKSRRSESTMQFLETARELEIAQFKRKLAKTDYKDIKYAEGEMTAEEYAEAKSQRAAWRARINELEAQLAYGE